MFSLPPTRHDAIPQSLLTASRAHRIMQHHKHCPISVCAAKAQAKQLLIATGKLVPTDAPHVGG